MRVLIVNGFDAGDDAVVRQFEERLKDAGHSCTVNDLEAEGFGEFMSCEERVAYHSERPLISPQTQTAARQVVETQAILITYPQRHMGFPPRVKSWNERVFVPGVGFRFKPSGVVTGALDHLKHVLIVEVGLDHNDPNHPKWPLVSGRLHHRSAPGPTLARSFRLTSNRKCRARFRFVNRADTAAAFRQLDRWK